jgi:hypothetical protein
MDGWKVFHHRISTPQAIIGYGRSLVAQYEVEMLGELPREEQLEFARLWTNATSGMKTHENQALRAALPAKGQIAKFW